MPKNTKSKSDSFDQDWDIEEYLDETEPEEHWLLRKQFMETHKSKFPEEYLVALARAFVNIEILGCSYPQKVMELVATLSEDIAEEFRESKKSKLKRTCISAQSAASDRASGRDTKIIPANK